MSDEFDVTAVADAVAEATGSRTRTTKYSDSDATTTTTATTPRALPTGWLLKESRSHPGCFYFFFIPTGLASWHPPVQPDEENHTDAATAATVSTDVPLPVAASVHSESSQQSTMAKPPKEPKDELIVPLTAPVTGIETPGIVTKSRIVTNMDGGDHTRESPDGETTPGQDPEEDDERASKRRKSSTAPTGPKEVRVLHILKKHKDSRRPSSWRQAKITSTLEEAKSELESLLEILLEEQGNFNELKATFEELARTESDCSSAKRGGDLGFFGRRKMQPPFEEASFALKIGELTKQVVETSSGVHLILRIG